MESIISFVLGGILTILVGWIFYRKSIKKVSLSSTLDYFSKLFDNVDQEIKKDLSILYKGNEIEHLYSVQFTIENNGNKPIRDLLEPLTLKIPAEFEIMDASISDIKPEGRNIELTQNLEDNKIDVSFPLLNSKELFVLRILFKGDVKEYLRNKQRKTYGNDSEFRISRDLFVEKDLIDDFEMKITVDELPPKLDIIKSQPEKEEDKELGTGLNIFHLILGLSIGYSLWLFTNEVPENFIFDYRAFFTGFWSWFYKFNFFKLSLLIAWLVALYFTIKSAIILIINLIKGIGKYIE